MTARPVWYVSHPLSPLPEELSWYSSVRRAHDANVRRALRWLAWLRINFPAVTFVAPWIADVMSGADDADPAQRATGLLDCCTTVELCSGIVLTGGRVSSGMERESRHARSVIDLTSLGNEPPAEIPAWLTEVVRWSP